jgi:predicted nucleic acid-binding protein
MLLVVADTSPIRYLVEIRHMGILPQLFERIFIPSVVYDELRHPSAPAAVRTAEPVGLPGKNVES